MHLHMLSCELNRILPCFKIKKCVSLFPPLGSALTGHKDTPLRTYMVRQEQKQRVLPAFLNRQEDPESVNNKNRVHCTYFGFLNLTGSWQNENTQMPTTLLCMHSVQLYNMWILSSSWNWVEGCLAAHHHSQLGVVNRCRRQKGFSGNTSRKKANASPTFVIWQERATPMPRNVKNAFKHDVFELRRCNIISFVPRYHPDPLLSLTTRTTCCVRVCYGNHRSGLDTSGGFDLAAGYCIIRWYECMAFHIMCVFLFDSILLHP